MLLSRLSPWSAGAFLVIALGCQRTPEASSDAGVAAGAAPSVTAAAPSASPSPTAPSPADPTPAPSSDAPAAVESCEDLLEAVVAEAKSLGPCDKDESCGIHRSVLCNVPELDCYAIHVNKERDPAKLAAALDGYAARCPLSKCKCAPPGKSVCRDGMCVAE